jgi:hypothetical protein
MHKLDKVNSISSTVDFVSTLIRVRNGALER